MTATPCKIPVTVLRIGQITGPTRPDDSPWPQQEWIPSVIKTANSVGVLPVGWPHGVDPGGQPRTHHWRDQARELKRVGSGRGRIEGEGVPPCQSQANEFGFSGADSVRVASNRQNR